MNVKVLRKIRPNRLGLIIMLIAFMWSVRKGKVMGSKLSSVYGGLNTCRSNIFVLFEVSKLRSTSNHLPSLFKIFRFNDKISLWNSRRLRPESNDEICRLSCCKWSFFRFNSPFTSSFWCESCAEIGETHKLILKTKQNKTALVYLTPDELYVLINIWGIYL